MAERARLTPQVEQAIYDLLIAGNFPKTACEAVGVPYNTYLAWIRRGEGRDRKSPATPEYVAFANRMRQAEAQSETQIVDMVVKGIPKDPSIGLRFLGRRWRQEWAESLEVNVNWLVKAVEMVERGDVSLEMLESEIGPQLASEVRAQLSAPATEGEFVEIEEDALQSAE